MFRSMTVKGFAPAVFVAALALIGLPAPAYCQFTATLFTTTGNEAIHLDNAAGWKLCIEPTNTQWQPSDVDVNSIRLISNGTGSVSQIPCVTNKPIVVADRNGNGLQDMEVTFTQANLQALFSNFHGHKVRTVTVSCTGNLVQGGNFTGTLTIQVYP